jgi:hypothetical protein
VWLYDHLQGFGDLDPPVNTHLNNPLWQNKRVILLGFFGDADLFVNDRL